MIITKFSEFFLIKFFTWLLLMKIIGEFLRTWACLQIFANSLKVSFFSFKNETRVNQEKSYTITKICLLCPKLCTGMGSHRSMWRSSSGLDVLMLYFCLNELRTCFPLAQTLHKWSFSKLYFRSPCTNSFLNNFRWFAY